MITWNKENSYTGYNIYISKSEILLYKILTSHNGKKESLLIGHRVHLINYKKYNYNILDIFEEKF